MIRPAPMMFAPMVAHRPTGPWANTATTSPNCREACSAPMKPVESMSQL